MFKEKSILKKKKLLDQIEEPEIWFIVNSMEVT